MVTLVFAYLLLTTLLMLLNSQDFRTLLPGWKREPGGRLPLVSICIPARNEAENIEACVRSALAQEYSRLEVLALDDGSEDATPSILRELADAFPERFVRLRGKPLPEGWLGKPWACQQLAEAASGEILIFIDADTRLEPEAAGRTVRTMAHEVVDLLTLWPQQVMDHFWARRVIPVIYHALLAHLPVRYVSRAPRWLPPPLRRAFAPWFAAACGQFIAFRRDAYERIGGHAAVRDRIVEDVALARVLKRGGGTLRMFNGADAVRCRMYPDHRSMWEGFRKNFLAGFGGSVPLFVAAALWNAAAWVLPWLTLAWAAASGNATLAWLSAAALLLAAVQRSLLARLYGWSLPNGLTHALGVLWFEALALRVLADRARDVVPRWKGRELQDGG